MSWVMPAEFMIRKLHSYSHPEYRKYANLELLEKAIKERKYIFSPGRSFNIKVLDYKDDKIPKYLQKENIFDYTLDDKGSLEIPK